MEMEIAKRVGAGWRNLKKSSGVLCDRRMPVKLKGKVYKTVIRPTMLYGGRNVGYNEETKKLIENATMDVTRKDKIRNEHIRGTTRVTQALTNYYKYISTKNTAFDQSFIPNTLSDWNKFDNETKESSTTLEPHTA